ncbi:MAG: hypothetical protein WC489_08405, partial [Patescibacteria group bacterium]
EGTIQLTTAPALTETAVAEISAGKAEATPFSAASTEKDSRNAEDITKKRSHDTTHIEVSEPRRVISIDNPIYSDVKLAHDTPESQRTAAQVKLVEAYVPETIPVPTEPDRLLEIESPPAYLEFAKVLPESPYVGWIGKLASYVVPGAGVVEVAKDVYEEVPLVQQVVNLYKVVADKPEERMVDLGLMTDDGRITEKGNNLLVNQGVTNMLVTGSSGPIMVDNVTFEPDEVRDIVLKYGSEENIAALQSSPTVSKYLSLSSPSEWSDAKLRVSDSEDKAATIQAVKSDNTRTYVRVNESEFGTGKLNISDSRILTTEDGDIVVEKSDFDALRSESGYNAGYVQSYTVPTGMDPESYISLRSSDQIRSTSYRGKLDLTDEAQSKVNTSFNDLLISALASDEVEVPKMSSQDKELLAFGLNDSQVEMLTTGVESEYDGQHVSLQSAAGRILDDELYDLIVDRQKLTLVSENPGLAVALDYQDDWIAKGWLDESGNLTSAGLASRDSIFNDSILGTSYVRDSDRAFAFSMIDDSQREQLKANAGAYERLDLVEQSVVGERELSWSERLLKTVYSGTELAADILYKPAFDDPTLNSALFVFGFLPVGRIAGVGSDVLGRLTKSDSGLDLLVKSFKKSDNIEEQAKALKDAEARLDPADFKALSSAIRNSLGDARYGEITSAASKLSSSTLVSSSAWANKSTFNEVRLASLTTEGKAALASKTDREWATYLAGIGDPDKVSLLESARAEAIKLSGAATREPEHMTFTELASVLGWGSTQEKLATKSPEVIDTIKTNTKLGASIDDAASIGKKRLAIESTTGKDFYEYVSAKPISNITKEEAALLSNSEFLKLQQSAPEHLSEKLVSDLLDKRSAGLADIVLSSGKPLTDEQVAIITKLNKGDTITSKEAAQLQEIANTVGQSTLQKLFSTYATKRNITALAAAGVAIPYTAYKFIGNVAFGQFIVEEQDQTAIQFNLMGATDDPMIYQSALQNALGIWTVGDMYWDHDLNQLILNSDFLSTWVYPQTVPLYSYHYSAATAFADTYIKNATKIGIWDENAEGFTVNIAGVGDVYVTGFGGPVSRDDYLDKLNSDPSLLGQLDPSTTFPEYLGYLYEERGWDDDRAYQEFISGNLPKTIQFKNSLPTSVVEKIDAFENLALPDAIKKLSPEDQKKAILSGDFNLNDTWKLTTVQEAFLNPDGTWDTSSIVYAVESGRLSLYQLNTHSTSAVDAIIDESNWNPELSDIRSRFMADEDTAYGILSRGDLSDVTVKAMVMSGTLAPNVASKAGYDYYDVAGLPDTIPILPGASDEYYARVVLYDESIPVDDRREFLEKLEPPANAINEAGWSYLYAAGVIDDETLGKQIGYDRKDIVKQNVQIKGADAARQEYLASANTVTAPVVEITITGTMFGTAGYPVGWLSGIRTGAETPTSPAGYLHLNALDEGKYSLGEISSNPEFWENLSDYYSKDPAGAA